MAQQQHKTSKPAKRASPQRPRSGLPTTGFAIDLEESDAQVGARIKKAFQLIGKNEDLVLAHREKAGKKVFARKGRSYPRKGSYSATADAGLDKDAAGLTSSSDKQSPLEGALARARERGQVRAAEILSGKEMISGDELGRLIGISRQAIDKRRKAGDLIALDGPARGVKYPRWQVSDDGFILPGISEVLTLCNGQAWTAYRHLVSEFPDGTGDALYTKLRQGFEEEVLDYVESLTRGEFG